MAITPYLYCEDVRAMLHWLEEAFGFERYDEPMTSPDGTITHAAMRFGEAVVMLGHPGPSYKNPRRLGQATQSLYVSVADVDAHFARARQASGGTILEEPKNTDYGARRYGIEDPEGHQWYFATP